MNQSKPSFEGYLKPSLELQQQLERIIPSSTDNTFEDILPIKLDNNFTIEKLQWEDFVGEVPSSSYWLSHIYWGICYSYSVVGEERKPVEPRIQRSSSSRGNVRQQSPKTLIQRCQNQDKGPNLPKPPLKPPQSMRTEIQTSQQKDNNCSNHRNRSPSPQNKRQNSRIASVDHDSRQKDGSQKRSNSQQSLKNQGQQIIAYKTLLKLSIKSKCYLQKKSWVNPEYKSEELLDHERGHYLLGCLCAMEFKRQAENFDWEENENTGCLQSQVSSKFNKIWRDFLQVEKNYDNETNHYLNREMQHKWNHKIKEQLKLYQSYFEK